MALAARHAFDGEARLDSGGQSVLGAHSADVHWSLFPEQFSDGGLGLQVAAHHPQVYPIG